MSLSDPVLLIGRHSNRVRFCLVFRSFFYAFGHEEHLQSMALRSAGTRKGLTAPLARAVRRPDAHAFRTCLPGMPKKITVEDTCGTEIRT
jgi:hypothetical protein